MSSSRRGSWSLRTRLLVGQVLLLGLVCLVIGAATEFALRRYLVHQLDQSLHEASHRAVMLSGMPLPPPMPGGHRWRQPGPGPDFLDAPGQPVGVVAAVVGVDGRTVAGVLTTSGEREAVNAAAVAQLEALAPRTPPVTAELDGLGRYRLYAAYDRVGNSIVTGLPLADLDSTMLRVLLIMAVVAVLALIAASVLSVLTTRRALRPLTEVVSAAQEVANLPLDRGEVQLPVRVPDTDVNPNTEVGQLGSAINRMLDHVVAALSTRQASETRVRQFVADASHELRTPLAAISGYTELTQRHHADLPDEVIHAIGRVASESDRMTHLVEDLLLLARLDSGRPLEQDSVDLSQLAVDTVSDAHAAGPEHIWNLDLPDDPVLVTGDTARLHQVLANLLANARVHTPPRTAVTVALKQDGDHVALSVTDDGPGIPPELVSEVFERFARGDSSRSRGGGSTGLGLAIVAAVVRAHGGDIAVQSRPGHTQFEVRLPAGAGGS